jgi:hypothetical protein
VCVVNGYEWAKRLADQVADLLGRVLLVPGCITADPPYLLWYGWLRSRPSSVTFAVSVPRPGDEVAVILLFRGAEPAGTAAEHGRARADVLREEWS